MNAARVIADLRELDRLTGGEGGARRVCWTDEWAAARRFLRELLAELPAEVWLDSAGNLFAGLEGGAEEVVLVGSHLDSVPAGGWLDGALGVLAAVEVLREEASSGRGGHGLTLVDWADEEGARFGRSLLGSSAFAGTLEIESVRGLRDAVGVALPDALAAHGVDIDEMTAARSSDLHRRLAAYLELHIEQGPVLEAEGVSCAAVSGTMGVERHRVVFEGRAAHAGSTPMDRRRDAGVAAAQVVAGMPAVARHHAGVCTVGRMDLKPGVATVVPGRAEILVDQRHRDVDALDAMLLESRALWEVAALAEGCRISAERVWSIAPVPFHGDLVAEADAACARVTGQRLCVPSGALHDAAEIARLAPAVMMFATSVDGVSHAPGEDTAEADLAEAITAFGALARRVVENGVP